MGFVPVDPLVGGRRNLAGSATYPLAGEREGCDVNMADCDKVTPLHVAKSLEVVQILLNGGVDPASRELIEDNTPLLLHLCRGNYDIIKCRLSNTRGSAHLSVCGIDGAVTLSTMPVHAYMI